MDQDNAISTDRVTLASRLSQDHSEVFLRVHNIPLQMNPHFLAREHEIETIAQHLKSDSSGRNFKSFALWGTGGIGKTQIALDYAWRAHANGTNAVLWVDCETKLSIASSFTQIANVTLQLEGALQDEDENFEHNRHIVLNWLRKTCK